MKILYINTSNIKVAREMIIRTAIKEGMKYVEMEDEVLINTDILVRIISKEFQIICSSETINLRGEKRDYKLCADTFPYLECKKQNCFYKPINKKQQKLQSQYVKTKIKKNRYLR